LGGNRFIRTGIEALRSEAGHCAEEGTETSEKAGTADEYEYRCAEYEYE
jgi:hypothetical protein